MKVPQGEHRPYPRLTNITGWPWLILYLGLVLRLWGITWQLPALLYPDELKYAGWAGAVADNRPPETTDFRNPSLYRHLLLLEYRVVDAVSPLREARDRSARRTALARLTSAVLGAGGATLTGLAAAAFFGTFAGLVAGLIMAIGPLPVHIAHIAINDTTALFFFTAGLYFGARAWLAPRWQHFILAGLAAGLATAGKYNFGVIGLTPLLGLPMFAIKGRIRLLTALGLAGIVVLAGLVGLVTTTPEVLTATAAVRDGILIQAAKGAQPKQFQPNIPVPLQYLEGSARGLGLPAMAFALLGATRLLAVDRGKALALLACPTVYLLAMLRSELFAVRYVLPVLPFAAILAAVGVQLIREHFHQTVARRAFVGLAVALIVLPAAWATVQHNILTTTRDTRLFARDWLRDHARRVTVATQTYSIPVAYWGADGGGDFRLYRFESLATREAANRLACQGARYVLVNNFWYEREINQPSGDGGPTGYDWLFQNGTLIDLILPYRDGQIAPAHPDDTAIPFWYMTAYARPGPRIEIWQLPEDITSQCPNRRGS